MTHLRRGFWRRYKRCVRCDAAPGSPCVNKRTGEQLRAAHPYRPSHSNEVPCELTIRWTGNEEIVVLVDGAEVGRLNHDEHGWAAMAAATDLARAIAQATGMIIQGEHDRGTVQDQL